MTSARLVISTFNTSASKFTIHYGEIKTKRKNIACGIEKKFTIHYGEIKTNGLCAVALVDVVFTIHYGEIKTQRTRGAIPCVAHLQSTMVRLRRTTVAARAADAAYLQSTMVRLRRFHNQNQK